MTDNLFDDLNINIDDFLTIGEEDSEETSEELSPEDASEQNEAGLPLLPLDDMVLLPHLHLTF